MSHSLEYSAFLDIAYFVVRSALIAEQSFMISRDINTRTSFKAVKAIRRERSATFVIYCAHYKLRCSIAFTYFLI